MVTVSHVHDAAVNGQVLRLVCPNSPHPHRGVPRPLLSQIGRWFGTPVAVETIRLSCGESPENVQSALEEVGRAHSWPDRKDILAFVIECDQPTWDSISSYEDDRGPLLDCMRSALWHRVGNSLSPV